MSAVLDGDIHTALTLDDLKALRKEFGNDFTDLLLPGHQVKRDGLLGEGMYKIFYTVHAKYHEPQ